MKTLHTPAYIAGCLYISGWRSENVNDLIAKYHYTTEEADSICAEIKKLNAE